MTAVDAPTLLAEVEQRIALLAGIRATPWAFSPWLVLQAEQLPALVGAP